MAVPAEEEPVAAVTAKAEARPTRSLKIALGAVAVAVLAALYALAIISFNQESARSPTLLVMGDNDADRLDILAKVISADPVGGEMLVRLDFKPQGKLAADALSPSKTLKVVVNTANGRQEQTYDKGEAMSQLDVLLNMDGQAAGYPFDKHQVELELEVATEPAAAAEESSAVVLTQPAGEAADDAEEYVPMNISLAGSLHGLRIAAAESPESTEDYRVMDITVSRSLFTVAFAVFAMVVMWSITAAVLFLMLSVLFRQRRPDMTQLSLSAVLLFGFYAFRNSMPGTPPIGTLSDVMAFFWAEATAALALITFTFVWVSRSGKV